MDNEELIARLASITDKEFAELFDTAVAERDAIGGENDRRFVLAETGQFPPNKEQDTVFVAVEDRKYYLDGWADDFPICQTGQCGDCGSIVRNIAKHAICPRCQTEAYCT